MRAITKKLQEKRKSIAIFLVVGLVILVAHYGYKVGLEDLRDAIQGQGIKGQIIYIVYTIISVPILTLPSFPLWPLVYVTFGYLPSVIMTTIGVSIGSGINFYLARRWGQKLVIKIVGKKKYEEIESFIGVDDVKTFLVLRLFGHNVFDVISYVAGFSELKFKPYIIITSTVSFVWFMIGFAIVDQIVRMPSVATGIFMVVGYVVTLAMAGYVIKKNQEHKRRELERKAAYADKRA